MIREATLEDIPWLADIGRKFFAANEWPVKMNFSDEFLEKTLTHLINDEAGYILRNDHGCIGCLFYPHYFTGELTAQELFWWADKDGLKLLKAFENLAKEKGAKSIAMITLHGLNPERVGGLYERMGYFPLEHTYIKVI